MPRRKMAHPAMLAAVTATLFVVGCSFQRRSDEFACTIDQDCSDGLACIDGWCVAPGGGGTADGAVEDCVGDGALAIVAEPTSLTIEEGSDSGTVAVALAGAPGGAFDVAASSSDTGAAALRPATLTFDDQSFCVAQSIEVRPVDDNDANDESVTITLFAPGVADVLIDVTVIDQD